MEIRDCFAYLDNNSYIWFEDDITFKEDGSYREDFNWFERIRRIAIVFFAQNEFLNDFFKLIDCTHIQSDEIKNKLLEKQITALGDGPNNIDWLSQINAAWANNDTQDLLMEKYVKQSNENTSDEALLNLLNFYEMEAISDDTLRKIEERLDSWVDGTIEEQESLVEKYGDHSPDKGKEKANETIPIQDGKGMIRDEFLCNLFEQYRPIQDNAIESDSIYSLLKFMKYFISEMFLLLDKYCPNTQYQKIEERYIDFILYKLIEIYSDKMHPINQQNLISFFLKKTQDMINEMRLEKSEDGFKYKRLAKRQNLIKISVDKSSALYKKWAIPLEIQIKNAETFSELLSFYPLLEREEYREQVEIAAIRVCAGGEGPGPNEKLLQKLKPFHALLTLLEKCNTDRLETCLFDLQQAEGILKKNPWMNKDFFEKNFKKHPFHSIHDRFTEKAFPPMTDQFEVARLNSLLEIICPLVGIAPPKMRIESDDSERIAQRLQDEDVSQFAIEGRIGGANR